MRDMVAIIGARGGSKGLPRKNVAPFGGKPLIAWTIEAANQSQAVTRTVVTTDDPEIAAVAREYGADVPFLRPKELAEDTTPGSAAILHAVRWLDEHERYRPDIVINLQPTSPLRTAYDIDAAVALLTTCDADAVVSVTAVDHHPYWMKKITEDGWMEDFVPQPVPILIRQELPPLYSLNGAIYVARRDVLLAQGGWDSARTRAYIMPFERSVDIDTSWDFRIAELLLSEMAPDTE